MVHEWLVMYLLMKPMVWMFSNFEGLTLLISYGQFAKHTFLLDILQQFQSYWITGSVT